MVSSISHGTLIIVYIGIPASIKILDRFLLADLLKTYTAWRVFRKNGSILNNIYWLLTISDFGDYRSRSSLVIKTRFHIIYKLCALHYEL